jgi:hypothetical protein
MVDYQLTVDEIRSFLQASDQTLSDGLRELAAAYVNACQEVNQRLRRCDEFLLKGLRSEAIDLAQTEPLLLDLLAILDFPERPQWEEISLVYGLPAPPRLLLATAEALNEAYAVVQPQEHLLRKHRLLALRRAPLAERLGVMRELAHLDANNPVWADDLREFEKARLRQIEHEVQAANPQTDAALLTRICDEVRQTPWQAPPPHPLVQKVEKAARQGARHKSRQSLQKLENELHEAFGARDVGKAKRLRGQWEKESREADLPPDDPLWERVSPALDWLGGQERKQAEERGYQAALDQLKLALETNAAAPELQRRGQAVWAFERGMPPELEARYLTVLDGLNAAARRRKKRLLIGTLAGLFLAVNLVALVAYKANQARRVNGTVQDLKEMLSDGHLALARTYLDKLEHEDPHAFGAPKVVELANRLAEEEKKEAQRQALFKEALKEAEAAATTDLKDPTLLRVQALASSAEEKYAVRQLEARRTERAQDEKLQKDREFASRLNDVRDKVQRLEKMVGRPLEAAAAGELLDEVDKQVALLLREAAGHTKERREQARLLHSRFQVLREDFERQKSEVQLVNRMTLSLSLNNVPQYVEALEQYAKEFAQSPRSRDLQRAAQEGDLWKAVGAWNELVGPWNGRWFDVKPAEAKDQAEKLRQFLKAHPKFVEAQAARDYLHCLEAIARQDEGDPGSAAAGLRKVFDLPFVKDLWVFRLEDDRHTYYTAKDPGPRIEEARAKGKETFNLPYLVSTDRAKGPRVKTVDRKKVKEVGLSPQALLAAKVGRLPANFAGPTWEKSLVELAGQVRGDAELDPFLKQFLLREVLDFAGRGSYPLAQALAKHNQVLKDANLDETAPWIDPDREAEAKPVRELARQVIDKLPPLEDALKAAAEQKRQLAATFARATPQLVGWLARDKDAWQCLSKRELSGDWQLAVVVVGPDRAAAWQPVGRVVQGKVTIDASPEGLVEGRLVFARKAEAP